MIVKPRMRDFICTTAHPTGCAELVLREVEHMADISIDGVPKRILVIGCSGGYGLATRIAATFGGDAKVIGVSLERPPETDRTASAGWYSNRTFEHLAREGKHYARTIESDAFSDDTKAQVAKAIREDFGQIDLLVYSLAAPARRDAHSGEVHRATVMPTVPVNDIKSLDTDNGRIITLNLLPAKQDDIDATVAVMGGEDWQLWIDKLLAEGLLAEGFRTYHYSYLGSEATRPIYRDGTIGLAKMDVERAAQKINQRLGPGSARVVALKLAVTQASSAIPIVPLYASLLRAVMHDRGGHESPLDQIIRLLGTAAEDFEIDDEDRIRMDGEEIDDAVQAEIAHRWPMVDTDNLYELTDFAGYRAAQLGLFGFAVPGVDYTKDVDPTAISFVKRETATS